LSMKATTQLKTPQDLDQLRQQLIADRESKRIAISVCSGTGCRAQGSMELFEEFRRQLDAGGLTDVDLRATGCHGFCEQGPLVVIFPDEIFYRSVKEKDVSTIIEKTIRNGELVDSLLFEDPVTKKKYNLEHEVPFYAKQQRIVFRNNGKIDPTEIGDYIAADGYKALAGVLSEMTGEEVVQEVQKAGLRGRGGGGFPTGRKWDICRAQPGDEKYVICNGDEGDPGAFMDRSIMEGDPHSVLEGMAIGAYAIGASRGYIYVRAEYPLAVSNLTIALEQSRSLGLLGNNILGTDFSFDVEIVRGAGAFVCGEETSLLASIEGKRGMPRTRPPFPAQEGLYGKPTNINNVETWANIPVIIERGAEWFAGIGTDNSKGTKVFSLVGRVINTGLVEVPMGMTLREIVYDIGGGILKNRKFKAVQTGGPSGGCIPESLLDLPVDFDKLKEVGAMMGSGGMVVMDEDTCMVDVAKYFLAFLVDESCGKCVPCREGVFQMHSILSRIVDGEGRPEDIGLLREIGETVKVSALCALGQTAPNPVLTTMRYFLDEYEAHINEKRCPAGSCAALLTFTIDPEVCICCGRCAKECPVACIAGKKGKAPAKATEADRQSGKAGEPFRIDHDACTKCGTCRDVCPVNAVCRT